ncbi:MBL fold metallo-hydrolase, partial [Nonomuraea sp. NPDC049784]|uniref:MBL fold metallo-hydrolase n=1 Tax=Nonomuraea sp. NPDC049784 TaxID=3154361 RepID=UPI003400DFF2
MRDLIRIGLQGGWTRRDLSDAHLLPVHHGGLPPADPRTMAVTWIGHASWLVRVDGRAILIDPVWSNTIPGVRPRLTPPGVRWADLPAIDAVVVTHDHIDHFDKPTLARLPRDVAVLVPAKVGGWFRRQGFRRVLELDWWEQADVDGLKLACLPAAHWSGRHPLAVYRSLWASWLITSPAGQRIYHSGDTAYGSHFSEISARYPGIDLALIAAGAYAPRWFQSSAHVDPHAAVQ